MRDDDSLTITTWNLQGREPTDVAAITDVLRTVGTDVAVLQEVQRSQARRIAAELGFDHSAWAFKHWPIRCRAEGLAILSRHPIVSVDRWRISTRQPLWSYRRRVALRAVLAAPAVVIVDVHLGSDSTTADRIAQADRVIERLDRILPSVIAGDFNVTSPDAVLDRFAAAGFHDTFDDCPPTNWHGRDRSRPPMQRLDYIVGTPGIEAVHKQAPVYGDDGFASFPKLSDHLPVTVTLTVTVEGQVV